MYPTKPELAFHLGLLAMTLVHPVQTKIQDSERAFHDPDLDDVFITDSDVDFDDVFTRSRLHCAQLCSTRRCCFAFSASPVAAKTTSDSTTLCRGHAVITSQMNRASLPGSKTYVFPSRSHASAWLEKSCTDNSECWVSNSECYRNKCLCNAGYYYSHCADACVATCPKSRIQSSTFLRYPSSKLLENNMVVMRNVELSVNQCLELCRNHPMCVASKYYARTSKCHLQNVTALQLPGAAWTTDNKSDTYLKTCL